MARQTKNTQTGSTVQDAPRKRASPRPRERKVKDRGNGQGTVYEYKPGKWRWQVTLGQRTDGKRVTRSGVAETKTAAHDAMTRVQADHARGLIADPEKITVAQYAERWLRRQLEIRPRTAKRYGEELAYALEHIGAVRLQDIRATHMKDLMVKLSKRPMRRGGAMSTRTQAHVLTRLRSLFREAVSDQIIYANPMEGVKRVKGTRLESAGTALDFEQAARLHSVGWALYKAGLCRLWPALFTAVSVGLRRGEVMGLTWGDVDFERGVLHVRQTRVMGVDVIETSDPKTLNSRRDIHMPPSLVMLLKAHRKHQDGEREALGKLWGSTGAVFATELGEWTHPDNLKRALVQVVAWSNPVQKEWVWAGIPRQARAELAAVVGMGEALPAISPHDLRHTYATLALRRGVPVEVVSKVLGHARVSITLDVYRHVLDNERRALVVDLFEELPKAPAPQLQALN
ncbi:tyrosine-type recombinase/integrase [Deinococcus sp.]|uniref:tyrosine-type recombinase/integrase n=1 Tax=Deinococcus sp. TaxID=47478 RepID=UPI003CC5474E